MEWWYANPNCPGCGAKLRKPTCVYCGREYDGAHRIIPDPKDDPRRTIEPRKVVY